MMGIMILAWAGAGDCPARAIDICTDQNYWYPFTYEESGQSKGIHIDVAAKALTNLGYKPNFTPLPWKRCLEASAMGKYTAVVSASYKPDRARYLAYPPDAALVQVSEWRITQVEYVVITLKNSNLQFRGDLRSLSRPVRAPLGYSIVDDLRNEGIDVLTAPDIRTCMQQLIKSRRGTVITPPQNARRLNQNPRFSEKIKIHRQPIKTKSYFLVFPRKDQKLSPVQMQAVWNEIARLRTAPEYIDRLFESYAQSGKSP